MPFLSVLYSFSLYLAVYTRICKILFLASNLTSLSQSSFTSPFTNILNLFISHSLAQKLLLISNSWVASSLRWFSASRVALYTILHSFSAAEAFAFKPLGVIRFAESSCSIAPSLSTI